MKKLFSLLVTGLCFVGFVSAQDWGEGILPIPQRIWTSPVIYNYDEQVTWYFDLNNADDGIKEVLDDATLALWTWGPSNPGDGHIGGGYSYPQEELLLTHRGNYIYSITLTPTVLYNVTKAYIETPHYSGEYEMTGFVFHIRVFSADQQSNINSEAYVLRYPHYLVNDLKTDNIPATVKPLVINATTPLAIFLNNDYLKETITGDLFVTSGINSWEKSVAYDAANPDLTKAKTYFGIDDVYVFNINNPAAFYGVGYDYVINSLDYQFKYAGTEAGDDVYGGDESGFTQATPLNITGIKNVQAASAKVKYAINDGILTVNAAAFSVYNIAGIAVADAQQGSLDISGLPTGVYILKTAEGTAKFLK